MPTAVPIPTSQASQSSGTWLPPMYLFEFCDQNWIPAGARECLYEVMEACNSGLRSFNRQVAETVLHQARERGLKRIIELGAGRAPVCAELARMTATQSEPLELIPCDLVPNVAVYRRLAPQFPQRVLPIYEPVDLTTIQQELDDAVLVMAGMMHHIPFELRPKVLETLASTNSRMAMFEPLRRTLTSAAMAALSIVPAALLPLTFISRPGRFRRFLWCWFVPIVPLMFAWDGVTSCLRQWTANQWRDALNECGATLDLEVHCGFNSLTMFWTGRKHHEIASKETPCQELYAPPTSS